MSLKYLLIIFLVFLCGCLDRVVQEKVDPVEEEAILSGEDRVKARKIVIDSHNRMLEWKQIEHNLWQNKYGELGIKARQGRGHDIFIDIYITHFCCGDGSLNSVIDLASFQYLGNSFYKDKKHVYHYMAMFDGGNFWIEKDADLATFKALGDCYAKDKNRIYTERGQVLDFIDYKSFKTKKGLGCYAKDKNGYYFWDTKIDINDIEFDQINITINELKQL